MKDLGNCPKGHPWMRGYDAHGCALKVCLRCMDKKDRPLWDFSGCKHGKKEPTK